jgi:hypothetical protein
MHNLDLTSPDSTSQQLNQSQANYTRAHYIFYFRKKPCEPLISLPIAFVLFQGFFIFLFGLSLGKLNKTTPTTTKITSTASIITKTSRTVTSTIGKTKNTTPTTETTIITTSYTTITTLPTCLGNWRYYSIRKAYFKSVLFEVTGGFQSLFAGQISEKCGCPGSTLALRSEFDHTDFTWLNNNMCYAKSDARNYFGPPAANRNN